MAKPKALDLFCGAGGVTKGLQRAGFHVTGIDINPQPRYCGDVFIQGDATNPPVDLSAFDFIWASPPCQAYSKTQRLSKKEYPALIEEVRKLKPHVIENVPGAPLINYRVLCGSMFGLRTYRHRHFECSFDIQMPIHEEHIVKNTKMGRPLKDGEFMHVVGNFSGIKKAKEIMEIDWMTQKELSEAIPPAYSEYIGRYWLEHYWNV